MHERQAKRSPNWAIFPAPHFLIRFSLHLKVLVLNIVTIKEKEVQVTTAKYYPLLPNYKVREIGAS